MRYRNQQQGYALMFAIFLLVVFSALAAYMADISGRQQLGSVLELNKAKTISVAEYGLEYGRAFVKTHQSCKTSGKDKLNRSETIADSLTWENAGAVAKVECTLLANDDEDMIKDAAIFRLTVTACNYPDKKDSCPGNVDQSFYTEHYLQDIVEVPL